MRGNDWLGSSADNRVMQVRRLTVRKPYTTVGMVFRASGLGRDLPRAEDLVVAGHPS
jgi:hypothetical protein